MFASVGLTCAVTLHARERFAQRIGAADLDTALARSVAIPACLAAVLFRRGALEQGVTYRFCPVTAAVFVVVADPERVVTVWRPNRPQLIALRRWASWRVWRVA